MFNKKLVHEGLQNFFTFVFQSNDLFIGFVDCLNLNEFVEGVDFINNLSEIFHKSFAQINRSTNIWDDRFTFQFSTNVCWPPWRLTASFYLLLENDPRWRSFWVKIWINNERKWVPPLGHMVSSGSKVVLVTVKRCRKLSSVWNGLRDNILYLFCIRLATGKIYINPE